jgi:hypothetical protein
MQPDLANMSISELCDMLVISTQKLLAALDQKNNDFSIRESKAEVERIQAVIRDKKIKGEI